MRLTGQFVRGFYRDNPVLVLAIGLCPTLAVSTGVKNALGMGAAATFVLVCSNAIIALLRGVIPQKVRLPCFIVVIATFVSVVDMVMAGFFPALHESLGIFIPLIVVNCIILARAEMFASKNKVVAGIADGFGMGIGFTLALIAVSLIREIAGSWKLMGVPLTDGGFDPAVVMIAAPGAFMVLGLLIGLKAWSSAAGKRKERDSAMQNEYRAFAEALAAASQKPEPKGAA